MLAENETKVTEATAPETTELLADTEPAETKPSNNQVTDNSGKRIEPEQGHLNRRNRPTPDQVVAWFAACARCSFFLAAYQLEHGKGELESIAGKSKAGWLTLNWSQTVCKLVQKSYGGRMEMDCYHYGGVCPDCHRQFVFHFDEGKQPGHFRIEMRPRAGR